MFHFDWKLELVLILRIIMSMQLEFSQLCFDRKKNKKKPSKLPLKAVLQNGQNHKPPHVDKNLLP